MSFNISNNYCVIQGWMIQQLELKGNELFVYAIIYGFSTEEEQWFTGSLSYLIEWTRASKPTVIKSLKSLLDKGLIIKESNTINNITFCKYKSVPIDSIIPNLTSGKKTLLPQLKNFTGGGKKTLPNNITNNITNNIDNINSPSSEANPNEAEIRKEVIDYLNEKTGKHFKPNGASTCRLIHNRLKEEHTLDDFKKVIDNKCNDWLDDEKMDQYLKPDTLFSNKFEGYLNQKTNLKSKSKSAFHDFEKNNYDYDEIEKVLFT